MGGGAWMWFGVFSDMLMTGFITRIWDGLMRWEISRKVFGYGQEKRGWLWTAERAWPYLWQHNSASWLYLLKGSGQQGLFYDYTTGRYAK